MLKLVPFRMKMPRVARFGENPPKVRSQSKLIEYQGFGVNPGALRMFHYSPESGAAVPLVVILHGCKQTAEGYDEGTGWTDLASDLGFAVLAPEQSPANNLNSCFNWFQASDNSRSQGEAASICEMIEWMIDNKFVDRSRIYITGLSAGGGMAAAMLAAYPDVFAGGAIIAGLPIGAAANVPEALNLMRRAPKRTAEQWGDLVRKSSSHKGPWPVVSIWHGDADVTVHDSNGEALVAQWADVHGLRLSEFDSEPLGEHFRRSWRKKDGEILLQAFKLTDMGHGAPVCGPSQQRYGREGPYFLDVGISSTVHIAAFWGFSIRPATIVREHSAIAPPLWKTLSKNVGNTISDTLKSVGLG